MIATELECNDEIEGFRLPVPLSREAGRLLATKELIMNDCTTDGRKTTKSDYKRVRRERATMNERLKSETETETTTEI